MSYYYKVKLQFNLVLLSTINKVVAASLVDRRTSDRKIDGSQLTSKLAMSRYVLGKDTLRIFLIVAKQSTRCSGPARGVFRGGMVPWALPLGCQ